ncbi:hypothetical protein B0T18DRAFT_395406 [Schizothecium vesticola]|uniref:Uncharacterized protein n=1 Tax=Schizothecium vesticola TaxID=314040 RepID=A0AA40F8S2_9PEZI|nr:hypothetical protein B0T18DRAFT_395406 [Schizothecium vesticola]
MLACRGVANEKAEEANGDRGRQSERRIWKIKIPSGPRRSKGKIGECHLEFRRGDHRRRILRSHSCSVFPANSAHPFPLDSSRSAMIIRCQETRPRRDDGTKFLALHGRGVVGDCVRMFSRDLALQLSGLTAMAVWFPWISGEILQLDDVSRRLRAVEHHL